MTDFRALCARMADELDHYRQLLMDDRRETHPLATEARAALRPKPPSLKEQALAVLTQYMTGKTILTNDSVDTIRRALEALDD